MHVIDVPNDFRECIETGWDGTKQNQLLQLVTDSKSCWRDDFAFHLTDDCTATSPTVQVQLYRLWRRRVATTVLRLRPPRCLFATLPDENWIGRMRVRRLWPSSTRLPRREGCAEAVQHDSVLWEFQFHSIHSRWITTTIHTYTYDSNSSHSLLKVGTVSLWKSSLIHYWDWK